MQQNTNLVWHNASVTKEQRAQLKEQKPAILWFTGLSGSGKSTIANAVEAKLIDLEKHTYLLDGDNVRHGLNKGLSFSNEDRIENIRRIAEVAKLFVDSGTLVLTAFISPFQRERDFARQLVADGEFIEVFIDTPLQVCEQRDPKGLYDQARSGKIADFTGISSPYEAPQNPELTIHSADLSIDECANQVIRYLQQHGYLNQSKPVLTKKRTA